MWLFAYVWLRHTRVDLATKVSNLRNKSHLYSKMTTCVSNCPNFIATGVPIGLYGQTNGQAESNMLPTFSKLGA